jgi:putative acetyltransferase
MGMEIRPVEPHEIEPAKRVIATVCCELWELPSSPDKLLAEWNAAGFMADLDEVRSHYFEQSGTFLVLMDRGSVVGMGGIRRLDEDACELKRMWFLKEYRGKGLGSKLAHRLLAFAREAGYEKVKLEVFDPERQQGAIQCYERLGFYRIKAYNDGPSGLFMEMSI